MPIAWLAISASRSPPVELAIEDTELAAFHFLDLCHSRILKRLLFGVSRPPSSDEIARNVDEAVRVFFAAYGLPGTSSVQQA